MTVLKEDLESVCAVVVTYNRKELLLDCLEGLLKQTKLPEGICIIDNASTDGTPEFLFKKGFIKSLPNEKSEKTVELNSEMYLQNFNKVVNIHYIRMPKNLGGSGGFYEGMKRGFEKGYRWLWLLDDDIKPKEDALEKLLSYTHYSNIKAFASIIVNEKDGSIELYHRGKLNLSKIFPIIQEPLNTEDYESNLIEISFSSFPGLLLSRDLIEKIGFPIKEFFIYHDDVEYCIRINRHNEKILLVRDSVIFQRYVATKGIRTITFLGQEKYRLDIKNYWRMYFSIRNLTYIGKMYSKNKGLFYFNLIKNLLRNVAGIILLDDNKLKRINLIINAYIDGILERFDNNKPFKLLYSNGGEK